MPENKYISSLKKLKRKVYIRGTPVDAPQEHPLVQLSTAAVARSYALQGQPEHEQLIYANSHLDGRRINRFTHIHRSAEDLINKVKLQRLLGQQTGTCFQRCVGMDALNALEITTFELERDLGTPYHRNFNHFLQQVQEENAVCDGAMTDPKGDRSKRPHEQADPDLYLRVVSRNREGIVVNGAKCHQTGALNSHYIIAMPTTAMREEDRDYAVAFAVEADNPQLIYILGRQPSDLRKMEPDRADTGNMYFGGQECLIIFDHVFIPWERVFLCGEYDYSGRLVERFAGYHRQSYGGCKTGVGDLLIGAAASLAEYHGLDRASHIKDKLVEMIHLNETIFCCGIACSSRGNPTASGTYLVDLLLANVCKLNVTRFPYEIARLAEDIAGGLVATLPSLKDLEHPEIGPLLKKYFQGVAGMETTCRLRMLRFVENLTLGAAAAAYLTESLHGAGSPQAQRVVIARQADLEGKKRMARKLAGIKDD
ncbi:MAG: 4-hydroxybutyryl-CoA dehydratase [Firmicutes bacterium]|jgi:4-hydroxybutyryl-CoA dehydratase/vinylacetyl-CoA-Delta-isomerase|nr:4-hydroxybutyryl-CoA dehydratase [Bacillota bacterium]